MIEKNEHQQAFEFIEKGAEERGLLKNITLQPTLYSKTKNTKIIMS
jgi:hypothetical protein